MYKCPECGSTDVTTERRPNGDSKCLTCHFKGPTAQFNKDKPKEVDARPVRQFVKMNWSNCDMAELKQGDLFRIFPASEADKANINPETIYHADSDYAFDEKTLGAIKCTRMKLSKVPEQTVTDTPQGLYKKYHITKADGTPVNPEDKFIVLRYNRSEPWDALCRSVLLRLAREIEHNSDDFKDLQKFAEDLKADVTNYRLAAAKPDRIP